MGVLAPLCDTIWGQFDIKFTEKNDYSFDFFGTDLVIKFTVLEGEVDERRPVLLGEHSLGPLFAKGVLQKTLNSFLR
jgi:hypothetical protein